jgi:hypothetical protein
MLLVINFGANVGGIILSLDIKIGKAVKIRFETDKMTYQISGGKPKNRDIII